MDFLRNLRESRPLTTTIVLSTTTITDHQLQDYNDLGVECIIDKRIFKKRLEKTLRIIISSVSETNRLDDKR
jgi:hypothetical protein